MPNEIIYIQGRANSFLYLIGCSALVAVGLLSANQTPLILWVFVAFAGFGVAVFTFLLLFPHKVYLKLTPEGFEAASLFSKKWFYWSDIRGFKIIKPRTSKMIDCSCKPGKEDMFILDIYNEPIEKILSTLIDWQSKFGKTIEPDDRDVHSRSSAARRISQVLLRKNNGEDASYKPNFVPAGLRISYIIISISLLAYGAIGIYVNDLHIPRMRNRYGIKRDGIHLQDEPAIVMYAAIICACLVLLSVVIDHYDKRNNEHAYRSFAWTFKYIGFGCFAAALILHVLLSID